MPFYNFELRTSSSMQLSDRTNLPNCEAARAEATMRVGKIMQEHPDKLWSDTDWEMVVADDTGLTLYVIQVVGLNSAATMAETKSRA